MLEDEVEVIVFVNVEGFREFVDLVVLEEEEVVGFCLKGGLAAEFFQSEVRHFLLEVFEGDFMSHLVEGQSFGIGQRMRRMVIVNGFEEEKAGVRVVFSSHAFFVIDPSLCAASGALIGFCHIVSKAVDFRIDGAVDSCAAKEICVFRDGFAYFHGAVFVGFRNNGRALRLFQCLGGVRFSGANGWKQEQGSHKADFQFLHRDSSLMECRVRLSLSGRRRRRTYKASFRPAGKWHRRRLSSTRSSSWEGPPFYEEAA